MKATIFFVVSIIAMAVHVTAQDRCELGGEIFQRGENMGNSVPTLCGSPDEFPCFCNPDKIPPVECPYCTFEQQDGSLFCAKDGESVSYVDETGVSQTCECSAPTGQTLTKNCDVGVDDGSGVDDSSGSGGSEFDGGEDETCLFDFPGTQDRYFKSGEILDSAVFTAPCGADFPCFCNPSYPGQVDCPYCVFTRLGGELICSREGELVTFQNVEGANLECECEFSENDENGHTGSTATCRSVSDGSSPASSPSFRPPIDESAVCTLEIEDGQILTFQYGESYGDYVVNRCGTASQYPCYCNPFLPNQLECPYCPFTTDSGFLYCAADGEVISFEDGEYTKTCSCQIPEDPSGDPIRNCYVGPPVSGPGFPPASSPSTSPTGCEVIAEDGSLVTIPNGESFGDFVEGICGPPDEWPSFCKIVPADGGAELGNNGTNSSSPGFTSAPTFAPTSASSKSTSISSSTTRQFDDDEYVETINYPYCVFDNTENGTVVCAKSLESVEFIDDQGQSQLCECLYMDESLGGPQITCTPVGDSGTGGTDTLPPASSPTFGGSNDDFVDLSSAPSTVRTFAILVIVTFWVLKFTLR